MEQDGGGEEVGDQFSSPAVSIKEIGNGVRESLQLFDQKASVFPSRNL